MISGKLKKYTIAKNRQTILHADINFAICNCRHGKFNSGAGYVPRSRLLAIVELIRQKY
jgi:hypothetical protein